MRIVLPQVLPSAGEGFLREIFRLCLRETHAPQIAEQRALKTLYQQRECLPIAVGDVLEGGLDVHKGSGLVGDTGYTGDWGKGYK